VLAAAVLTVAVLAHPVIRRQQTSAPETKAAARAALVRLLPLVSETLALLVQSGLPVRMVLAAAAVLAPVRHQVAAWHPTAVAALVAVAVQVDRSAARTMLPALLAPQESFALRGIRAFHNTRPLRAVGSWAPFQDAGKGAQAVPRA